MRVIFLDIDGVLNAWDDFGGRSKPNPRIGGYWGISTAKVRRLEWLVNKTGAKIVLVSSWKSDYVKYLSDRVNHVGKYLHNKLRKRGLVIYDTTYDYCVGFHSHRGFEIHKWLEYQKESVESWVVLDDEIFSDYDKEIKEHLILTSETDGLTMSLAKKAACILLGLEDGALDTEFEKLCKEIVGVAFPKVEEQEVVVFKPDGPQNK